jgi:hypothetical protein
MNKKLLFYHIPKTGGRWVLSAMKAGGVMGLGRAPRLRNTSPLGLWGHHSTPVAMAPETKEGRFQFCFVRRPLDWYRSFWCFRTKQLSLGETVLLRHPGEGPRPPTYDGTRRFPPDDLWDEKFEVFVENILDAYPDGFLTAVYQCYVGPDNDWMNFVGRQESLVDDLIAALILAGEMGACEKRIRRRARVNTGAAEPCYGTQAVADPALVERIEKTERWVLETFYG